MMSAPELVVIIPCFDEEKVLPITVPKFKNKLERLVSEGKISSKSRILFVNDGSHDKTWDIIKDLSKESPIFTGISLSRNRGHQNALLAGLMEVKNSCDITISIDCDGQDDIDAMDEMIDAYLNGAEIVYGIRKERQKDSFLKRTTAQGFYRLMNFLGAAIIL